MLSRCAAVGRIVRRRPDGSITFEPCAGSFGDLALPFGDLALPDFLQPYLDELRATVRADAAAAADAAVRPWVYAALGISGTALAIAIVALVRR